jgi:predicted negative regulator of RcsB-dependent stress response
MVLPVRRATVLTAAALLTAGSAVGEGLQDLYFGEALFHASQGHHFEALERLDAEMDQHYGLDEPVLGTLHHHINEAEFFVGDFELQYRMHHRAGRAIQAVLEGDVDEPTRNEAAYRLARIHFQKDQPEDALRALERIDGPIPDRIRDDVEFLRANVYMALGRPSDAVDVLRGIQGGDSLAGFSEYNLGIALLQDGRIDEAIKQLDRAGRVKAGDPGVHAIRDRSNLVLGTLQFESTEFAPAQATLARVRMAGPYSNQALLRAGWADVNAENFERALVPWGVLAEREPTDAAVQEAIIALPYAYSRLNIYGRAARLYGEAVETFGEELDKVDASIRSIREGRFLEALVREEIRQDKDWVIRLRSLPDTPETYYLMALMASHDFQTALQNYLDLEDLRKRLVRWEGSFDAFDDIIEHRRAYYEPLLPDIDTQFRRLDAQIRLRLEQREHIERRLQAMLVAPRPDHLATASERVASEQLAGLEAQLADAATPETIALQRRAARLRGAIVWQLETQYHERLTATYEHLQVLNADVEMMQARYEAFVRARQAAMHSYVGYEMPINHLRMRVRGTLERLSVLMARQGHMLETVAINELKIRRDRLEAYQNQARYAFADSYDRAAKAQGAEPVAAASDPAGEEQG